jgi:hypothetical protein
MTFALERKAVFAAQANVALKKLRRGADKPSSQFTNRYPTMIVQNNLSATAVAAATSAVTATSGGKNGVASSTAGNQADASTQGAAGNSTASSNTSAAQPAATASSGTQRSAGGAGAASSSSASSNLGIAQLQQTIDRLKKQLATLEAQITAAAALRGPDGGPNPSVEALQGEAQSLQGALIQATGALAELMMSSGQTTGLVNEQA